MTGKRIIFAVLSVWTCLCVLGCDDHDKHAVAPCGDNWRPVEFPARNYARISIGQGVSGDVWFWEGNFMPMCPTGTVHAVSRELRVYELASDGDIEWTSREGHRFIRSVLTRLVATTVSDSSGFFELALPVGRYSLLAVEDSLLYANWYDDEAVAPVEVSEGRVFELVVDIDYRKAI
jgi:hypothetical protein